MRGEIFVTGYACSKKSEMKNIDEKRIKFFQAGAAVRYILSARLMGHLALHLVLFSGWLHADANLVEADSAKIAQRLDHKLVVPAGESDPATFIPLSVFQGSRPGPNLVIVAGVHGYEFAPILALQQLAARIDPESLIGKLTLVKLAHVSAFEARSPYMNPYDRKNLNRAFPGKSDGTQSERIAWVLSKQVINEADFVIDVHSGDGGEWLDAFVGVYGGELATDYTKALEVAHALNFPNIVRYSMDTQEQVDRGRSLNRQAVAAGAPTLLVEIGENGESNSEDVAAIVAGLQNVVMALGMTSAANVPAEGFTPRYFEGTVSVPVPHDGIWAPYEKRGRFVDKGDPLGVITDYQGKLLERVVAPIGGYALYGLAGPPVRAGESVMTIARPVRDLK